MSAGAPAVTAGDRGPSARSVTAAVLVVLALAALAGYTVFSGPTRVPAPTPGAPQTAPGRALPAGEPESGREGDDGR